MTNAHEPINSIPDLNNHPSNWYGLTKREYFAAIAMTALISEESNPLHYKDRAMEAVQMADALIEQLNKQ